MTEQTQDATSIENQPDQSGTRAAELPPTGAIGQAVDAAKTLVSSAAGRRPWTVIAWAFGAGSLIGLTIGALLF